MKNRYSAAVRFWSGILCTVAIFQYAQAEQFLYPKPQPIAVAAKAIPPWLALGNGDDGYVKISAEIVMPKEEAGGVTQSCIPLGKNGWVWNETTQVVLSVKTFGYATALDEKEIPIATFDSKGNEGGCIVPVKLPMSIVPLVRLEEGAVGDQGKLRLQLIVRSATNTSTNLVQKAQNALKLAAVFATGPAAVTVAKLSSNVGSAALLPMIAEYEQYASNVTPGTAVIVQDWANIRTATERFEIPIYSGEIKWNESQADAVARLQSESAGNKKLQFTVVFNYDYVRTLFDKAPTTPDYLPHSISTVPDTVLRYPNIPDFPTLQQLLNHSTPSEMQQLSTGTDLSSVCNSIYSQLHTDLKLSKIDRSIALKAFVDGAMLGPGWVADFQKFNSCFRDIVDSQRFVIKYFDLAKYFDLIQTPIFPDAANQPRTAGTTWLVEVPPLLAELRGVITSAGNRALQLDLRNHGQDIRFIDYAGTWAIAQSASIVSATTPLDSKIDAASVNSVSAVSLQTNPVPPVITKATSAPEKRGIFDFVSRRISKSGCFATAYDSEVDVKKPMAHLLLLDETDAIWHATVLYSDARPRNILEVTVNPVVQYDGWERFFRAQQFKEGAVCPLILAKFPKDA